ncbi:MAG: hypothetical protein HUK15_09245, partial [Bacteroidales bacterium]|nr:hypothetical protein [Bacteroidales bacterium]
MIITEKDEHIEFIQNLVKETKTLLDEGHTLVATLTMAQIIEIFGSYLDEKPMRSKEQSASRFNTALYRLFSAKYSKANRKSFLYYQLRTSLVHTLTPTCSIRIKSGESDRHLCEFEEIMEIYAGSLYKDVEKAAK